MRRRSGLRLCIDILGTSSQVQLEQLSALRCRVASRLSEIPYVKLSRGWQILPDTPTERLARGTYFQ